MKRASGHLFLRVPVQACMILLLLWGSLWGAFEGLPLAVSGARAEQTDPGSAAKPFRVSIHERRYNGAWALAVTATARLDPEVRYEQHLAVFLQDSGRVSDGWVLSEDETTLYFPHIEPERTYTVTVHPGFPALDGRSIETAVSQTVTTRAVPKAVGFASTGSVLPRDLSKGLPLRTVNVQAVDVDFFRIVPKAIPQFLSRWYGSGKQSLYAVKQWRKHTRLVYSGRYTLDVPDNTQRTVYLPVQDRPELRKPGLYAAVLKEAGSYDYQLNTTLFHISDLGLHARHYTNYSLVFATSLRTADPLPGVAVRLLNAQGEVIRQARTREDGTARIRRDPEQGSLLLASRGRDLAVLSLKAPALDLSEFSPGTRTFKAQELFIYGPRDIYRPGEQVRVAALLRDYAGRLLRDVPLQVRLQRPDGRLVTEFVWTPETLGWYTRRIQLPASAQTGIWKLTAETPDQSVQDYSLHVADFLPERLRIHFQQSEAFVPPEQPLRLRVKAEYLYGAPVTGNEARTTVQVLAEPRPLDALPGFVFGRAADRDYSRFFELPAKTLDQQGRVQFSIRPDWSDVPSPLKIRATVRVFESGGRPVARSLHFTTWPRATMIGIRPIFMDSQGQGRAAANSRAAFEIVTADRDGGLQAAENLRLRLIHEQRDYFWEEASDGWRRDFVQQDVLVFQDRIATTPQERTRVAVPVEWGHYRLEVEHPETGQTSSLRFEAGASWMTATGRDQGLRPDSISLSLDQKAYAPGDTVRLRIQPPYPGKGFVCVESDRLLWRQAITVEASGTTIEIPVDPSWDRHDLYISALLTRPAREIPSRKPKRSIGLLHLPLERGQRNLEVSLSAPAKIHPETSLSCRVQVTDQQGRVPAGPVLVTLAAADVGVLNLTDFQTPSPFDFFFSPRAYAPEMQDLFARVIEQGEGPLARPAFGGDADLSRGGPEPGTEVNIVSLFSGPVSLDADGTADIELEVPDFNGRLRLMALAFSPDSAGSAQTETTVAAPVVTTLSKPRFLAAGDRSTLSLELHNVSEVPRTIDLRLSPKRFLDMEAVHASLGLAPGGRWQGLVPISARGRFGQARFGLRMAVTAPGQADYTLNRTWTLGIRPAYPARQLSLRSVLSKNQSLALKPEQLEGLLPAGTRGQLLIADQPPLDLAGHLQSLLAYPYGCLEQITSRALPLLYADPEILRQFKIRTEPGFDRFQALDTTFAKLAGLQLPNGGFAMWDPHGPEAFWLTAFAADFLLTARDLGYQPPEAVLRASLKRLVEYVRSPNGLYREPGSPHPAHSALATRCYAGYVLSRVRQAPLSGLRLVFEHQSGEARSKLPLIHLGLALKNQGDHQRAEKALEQGLVLERPARTWLGDYGSRIRDLAQTLHLLLENGYDLSKADGLLYELADELQGRTWLSTQERAGLFRLGMSLDRQAGGEPWSATYILGQDRFPVSSRGTFRKHFDFKQLSQGLQVTARDGETLFARIHVQGYPQKPPQAVDQELHIERVYYDLQGRPLSPDRLEPGQLLVAHLTVRADRSLPDVLVADLLPAGLELEDQTLKHAMPISDIRIDGRPVRDWINPNAVSYQGFRDDRYLAAIRVAPQVPVDLFYLVQAVTPGTYTLPPPFAESMYLPCWRSIGRNTGRIEVLQNEHRTSNVQW